MRLPLANRFNEDGNYYAYKACQNLNCYVLSLNFSLVLQFFFEVLFVHCFRSFSMERLVQHLSAKRWRSSEKSCRVRETVKRHTILPSLLHH